MTILSILAKEQCLKKGFETVHFVTVFCLVYFVTVCGCLSNMISTRITLQENIDYHFVSKCVQLMTMSVNISKKRRQKVACAKHGKK